MLTVELEDVGIEEVLLLVKLDDWGLGPDWRFIFRF